MKFGNLGVDGLESLTVALIERGCPFADQWDVAQNLECLNDHAVAIAAQEEVGYQQADSPTYSEYPCHFKRDRMAQTEEQDRCEPEAYVRKDVHHHVE